MRSAKGALAAPLSIAVSQASEIELRIRRRAVPLRIPHHFAQAFEHRVQRRVLVAARRADALVLRANAGRLVDRELLGDREVQRQVQERIDVARLPGA